MKNKGKQSKSKGKASKEEVEQKKEDRKKSSGKSPQANQKGKANNQEEDKKKQEEKGKKLETFNLDFIYRREKFTVQKLAKNILISRLKLIIAKKISVEANVLVFFYKDKELKAEDDKKNVFEMIKDDPIPFIEVKKVPKENQDIISLNSKVNLVYKVTCSPVNSYSDLVDKIEQFFRDICLEKHYLCEPTDKNKYDVCFSCSDHCFQFKRYMMNISRTDAQYKKTKFDIPKVDKSKIIEPKIEKNKENEEIDENINKTEKIKSVYYNQKTKIKTEVDIEFKRMKHKEDDYFQKEFINTGPYVKYEEIKKKQENDDKKKWISKKKFSVV